MEKTELLNGKTLTFESDEHLMEVFFSKDINHHTGRGFVVEFNGKFNSFKTFKGLENKSKYFIDKYRLEQV